MSLTSQPDLSPVFRSIRAATRAIPPAWPLESSVAVNPFLGLRSGGIAAASERLGKVAGCRAVMPREWFAARIDAGDITVDDLAAAIVGQGSMLTPAALIAAARAPAAPPAALPTVAELAAEVTGTDWPAFLLDRIGAFAAAHFDRGQAFWPTPAGSLWRSWRASATHDLTPELAGLSGFAAFVRDTPEDAATATLTALRQLEMATEHVELYSHRLLVTLGGWAQLARQRQWNAELTGRTDDTIAELLAVRLTWEWALHDLLPPSIAARWNAAHARYRSSDRATDGLVDSLLQDAADRAGQRRLALTLTAPVPLPVQFRPALQAVFCIDVRSEILRRALERQDDRIETFGFAGFFGIAVAHRRAASDVEEARLPALLAPPARSRAIEPSGSEAAMRVRARAARAWGRFRLAAVSCFAFVEATGPLYAAKLVRDGLALTPRDRVREPVPAFDPTPSTEERIALAEGALRGMSLTETFAPLVLVVGHGADVVNNPHAAGLQCGACGGYQGDANARLLCGLLNDPAVREGLSVRGIVIPADTRFVPGLHDTTSDTVTLFDEDLSTPADSATLALTRDWLIGAAEAARAERAPRLTSADAGNALLRRGRDWAQVRPEWGLAGCHAFIAAPRALTRDRDLGGRAFLHSYDRVRDPDLAILTAILTAPVVVASWISLQYFGSTVAPALFGSGNKLLHNVVGGVGVLEGNGGPLRAGLSWQSVSDGEQLMHEPVRLSVCIAAATADIDAVLCAQREVRALFDDRWLHLFALDDAGRLSMRYAGVGNWQPVDVTHSAACREAA